MVVETVGVDDVNVPFPPTGLAEGIGAVSVVTLLESMLDEVVVDIDADDEVEEKSTEGKICGRV